MAKGKKILPAPPAGVMVFDGQAVAPTPQVQPKSALASLKHSQQVVVQAFLDPGKPSYLNGKRAYRAAHPNTTDGSAEVGGCRTLSLPKVQSAIETELTARGWSRARIEGELVWNLQRARALDKLSEHREANMALAKVRGDLVDKHEVKSLEDTHLQQMRRVVNELIEGEGVRERPPTPPSE